MRFWPSKMSKTCWNVRKVAKSPFNVTAARFVFTGSPIIFSKSHKTTLGAAVKLRGHLPSASTRFYWCLEAFMDVSRQNNCVELPLDVHKSLSTPVKFVSAEVKTSSFDCCLINSYYRLGVEESSCCCTLAESQRFIKNSPLHSQKYLFFHIKWWVSFWPMGWRFGI